MSQENAVLVPCRYCKAEIDKSLKRCPYCGSISPTLEIKSIFRIMFIVIVVVYVYMYFKT